MRFSVSTPSIYRFFHPALCCFLAACTQTGATSHVIDLKQGIEKRRPETMLASHFSDICLRRGTDAATLISRANERGWQSATEESLNAAGLGNLKKTVLKIPGGGGRVSESQELFVQSNADQTVHMAIEERFDRGALVTVSCSLYSAQDETLKICADIGNILDRKPERNTYYSSSDARFISWKSNLEGRGVTVSCQRAPQSAVLPFDGTVVSLVIDQTRENPLLVKRTNLPRAVDDRR